MIFQKIDLTLKVDNMNIERVKEFNFLGVMVDANLNCLLPKKGILNKLKHVLSYFIVSVCVHNPTITLIISALEINPKLWDETNMNYTL